MQKQNSDTHAHRPRIRQQQFAQDQSSIEENPQKRRQHGYQQRQRGQSAEQDGPHSQMHDKQPHHSQKRDKGGNFDNRELPEQDMHEEKYKIRTQRSFYDRKQFHQNQEGGGQYQQHYFKKK